MKCGNTADDPAFPAMTLDILSDVLSHAGSPGELGETLTEKLRELTGARCVIFIPCSGTEAGTFHRVAGLSPALRRSWAESPTACRMYEIMQREPVTKLWRAGDASEAATLLQPEGFALSMGVPLNAGPQRVGAMFLLGLPEQDHLSSAIGMLNTLATVVALVLRNAFLYERQEQIIQERTSDLQASHDALRESENRYRGLFENSPVPLWEGNCSGIKSALEARPNGAVKAAPGDTDATSAMMRDLIRLIRTKSINQAALDLIGADGSEQGPENLSSVLTDDSLRFVHRALTGFLRGESKAVGETTIRSLKGEVLEVAMFSIVPPGQESSWTSMVVAMIDITEQKRLANEAARAKRLESAGRLAGQIAHDFNSLLSPLVTYPAMVREYLPPNSRALHMLDDMEDAALQITEINQELLTLGRRGHYKQRILDLNDLIDSALRTVNLPHTIVVDLHLSPDLLSISGGGGQLTRVLINLLVNATEAMEGVGKLSITTDCTYLDRQLRRYNSINVGEYVRAAITDTGSGIPADILDQIFEPFFTTKVSDRRRGSGLGLSVVHAVVEDHKGYVDVSTSPGKGTTFYLYFPVSREAVPIQPASEGIDRGSGQRILVADDDPLQLRIARSMLEALGYNVQTVESGEEALAAVSAQVPDLVILDMIMAGIDGAEALRRIRENAPALPAIIFSGFAASDRVNAALAMGYCEFMAKPVKLADCACAVHAALQKQDRLSAPVPVTGAAS